MTDPVAVQEDLLQVLADLPDEAVQRIVEEHESRRDLQLDFERFHARHPEVYEAIVTLARRARARGFRRIGVAMIFEVLRWESSMGDDRGMFKLDNRFRSRYVRMLQEREPELGEMFETRRLRSA